MAATAGSILSDHEATDAFKDVLSQALFSPRSLPWATTSQNYVLLLVRQRFPFFWSMMEE